MKPSKILVLLALALPMALCSCSDDGGQPASSNSMITTLDGDLLQVTSVKTGTSSYSGFTFSYDQQGRCTHINNYGELFFYFEYDPFKVTTQMDNDDENYSMSFNGSGYVANDSYSGTYNEDGERGSETYSTSYSYSGDHLTKVTSTYSDECIDVEDGYKESYSGTATATLSWENNDISKVVISYDEKWEEDGESGRDKGTETYTYSYSDTENGCRQMVHAVYDVLSDLEEACDGFAIIGWLGRGTAHLPSSYKCVWEEDEDGDIDAGSYSSSFTYTMNSNGTLRNDGSYTYTYEYFDDDTRSAAVVPFGDALSAPAKTKHSLHGVHNRVKARHTSMTEE